MKNEKKRFWKIVTLLMVLGGSLIVALLTLNRPIPDTLPQSISVPSINAHPLRPQQGHFHVTASGRVQPMDRVVVRPQVNGDVVMVSEKLRSGESFQKGDLLLRISPVTFQASVDELKAQIETAKADLILAKKQLARTQQLANSRAISIEELDLQKASVQVALAREKQTIASLKRAQIDLDRTAIYAPFDGHVVSENVSIGDVVSSGTALAEIYSTKAFEVPISLPVKDASLLGNIFAQSHKHNDILTTKAELSAEFAGNTYGWESKIDRIEMGLDNATRTIDIVLTVEESQFQGKPLSEPINGQINKLPLLPSMFVEAKLKTAEFTQFFKIKREALRADNTIWYVAVNERQQGKIQIAKANVLSNQNQWAYITLPDLNVGNDYVLGTDIGSVLPGTKVHIQMSESTLSTSL